MFSETSNDWFKAAIILSENPAEKVDCPVCKEAFLSTTVSYADDHHCDIYLHCSNCKACNILTLGSGYRQSPWKVLLHPSEKSNTIE
jgi:C4-type Zn-finger protein